MADSYGDFQNSVFDEIEEKDTDALRAKLKLAKSLGIDPIAFLKEYVATDPSMENALEALDAEIAKVQQQR